MLITLLKLLWFKELGEGMFSTVFSIPFSKTLALKVGNGGDGWPAYAEIACSPQFKNHRHALRIYWFVQTPWGYLALMERLKTTIQNLDGTHPTYEEIRQWDWDKDHPLSDDLVDIMAAILKVETDNRFYLDIHRGNFMIAYDGRFVITDPLGFRSQETVE